MITINENLLGLVICGPVFVAFGAGLYTGWVFFDQDRANSSKELWAIIASLIWVVSLILTVTYIAGGFKDGVTS